MNDQMNIKQIIERFPFLQLDNWPLTLEIPRGWYTLFLQMCEEIRQSLLASGKLYDFCFLQVKEKFNQLTCYTSGETEEVQKILAKYAKMSRYVCSKCGKPAVYETTDYILSFCNECSKELQQKAKPNWRALEPCNMPALFKDEWKRYLERINYV